VRTRPPPGRSADPTLRNRVSPPPRLSAAASRRRRVTPPPRLTAAASHRRRVSPPPRLPAAAAHRRRAVPPGCGSEDATGDSTLSIQQVLNWDDEPEEEIFATWVRQSVNKTVLTRLAMISTELQLAEALNATYVTESEFESGLIALSVAKDLPRNSRQIAVNFLNTNAPFLNIGSGEAVARLRRDYPGLFEKFQATLLDVASQLTGAEGDFEDRAKQLFVKEIEPQIQAVNAQLSKVVYQAAGSVLLAAGSVGLALLKLPDIPFSVLLTALAGATAIQGFGGTLPSIGEYVQKRRTPAFIWSRIAKK
jgi:hypothetical protein